MSLSIPSRVAAGTGCPLRMPAPRTPRSPASFLAALCLLGFSARVVAAAAAPAASPGAQTVNVLVISFDPVLKAHGNLKLHEYLKWSDPWRLTDQMVEDARACSSGYVEYRAVEKIDHDGFTTFRNGFTYTEETFLDARCWRAIATGLKACFP